MTRASVELLVRVRQGSGGLPGKASPNAAIINRMHELIFLVDAAPEGGFAARALGQAIFTEADDLEGLHRQIRDAVHCHFDQGITPRVIRLQFACHEGLS